MKQSLYQIPDELILDIIGVEEGKDQVHLPTLSVCPVCSGYIGFSLGVGKPFIYNRQLAYEIALINYGKKLSKWDSHVVNRKFVPKPCTCGCTHIWKRKELEMHYYEFTCKKCGKTIRRGSSG